MPRANKAQAKPVKSPTHQLMIQLGYHPLSSAKGEERLYLADRDPCSQCVDKGVSCVTRPIKASVLNPAQYNWRLCQRCKANKQRCSRSTARTKSQHYVVERDMDGKRSLRAVCDTPTSPEPAITHTIDSDTQEDRSPPSTTREADGRDVQEGSLGAQEHQVGGSYTEFRPTEAVCKEASFDSITTCDRRSLVEDDCVIKSPVDPILLEMDRAWASVMKEQANAKRHQSRTRTRNHCDEVL